MARKFQNFVKLKYMRAKWKHFQKTNHFSYLIITFAAIIYILGIQMIMQVAHTLSSELDAIPLVITILVPSLSKYFGLLYLAINLPILVLFYKKIRRRFIVRTFYFLIVSTAFSSIFFIPGVENTLQNLITNTENVFNDKWPMFVLPIVGGAIVGSAIALSWKYGGSTGGADVIVYYFSTKKQKQVGHMMLIVSLVIMAIAFGAMIGIKEEMRHVWLPAAIGSITYVVVLSIVVNLIFPKYQKVQIEIHSSKINEISSFMKINHGHPFRIEDAISGYLTKDMKYITTVILILELKDFQKAIKTIDPNSWIAAIPVSNVFGRFNTKSVDGN